MPEYENLSASERYMHLVHLVLSSGCQTDSSKASYISHLLTGSRIQAYYSWYLLVLVSNILDFFLPFQSLRISQSNIGLITELADSHWVQRIRGSIFTVRTFRAGVGIIEVRVGISRVKRSELRLEFSEPT